nr:hypothetical protein [uncultured Celeribacter sp.]
MKIETVTFTFEGDLPVVSFADFAQHRATRLSVELVPQDQTERSARMQVTGQVDLVDAFEMAMSLGPEDCIVHDVSRADVTTDEGEQP